jgi:hypothetical protein
MNPQDIRTSSEPDLAGSFAAMERVAREAQDLAIKTNTGIVVAVDGKTVELTTADLIKMRDQVAPATRTVAVTSSSKPKVTTLWGMVISAPQILVRLNTDFKNTGYSGVWQPIGTTTALMPALAKYGL